MSWILIATLNTLLGALLMHRFDDGTMARWCDQRGLLALPCGLLVATLWPAPLAILWWKHRQAE
jgi:hypothetical protein